MVKMRSDRSCDDLLDTLRNHGGNAWIKLNETERWKKEIVLAVLQSNYSIPSCMFGSNWNNTSPESIRYDRDVLLARLRNPLVSRYFYMECYLLTECMNDKEVMCELIRVAPDYFYDRGIPDQYSDDIDILDSLLRATNTRYVELCLPQFSKRIRSDRYQMLKVAKSIYCSQGFFRLIIGEDLISDPEFALEYYECTQNRNADGKVINALRHFADIVKSNRQVVMKYLEGSGICLKHASHTLRADDEVVATACNENPVAIVFADISCDTTQRLRTNKTFMLDALKRADKYRTEIFQMISEEWNEDMDVVVAACKYGCFNGANFLSSLMEDKKFWKHAIHRDASCWNYLPEQLKDDIELALSIRKFSSRSQIKNVFDRFPVLRDRVEVWEIIVDQISSQSRSTNRFAPFQNLQGIFLDHAPAVIFNNKGLMLKACQKKANILDLPLPDEFITDKEFVETVIDCHQNALFHLPPVSQDLYPELVIRAIQKTDEPRLYRSRRRLLTASCWANPDVTKTWFQCGGRCPYDYPEELKRREDIALVIAEYGSEHDFMACTVDALRSDKSFMVKAIELRGTLYFTASESLQKDLDIALLAIGGELGNQVHIRLKHSEDSIVILREIYSRVDMLLEAFECFMRGFLPGMSNLRTQKSPLLLLQQGDETSQAIKKTIGDFVGVPKPKEVGLLYRAKAIRKVDNP